jgi:2-keto-3-deoxy-L-rhamnonate aldolase RhmA
MITKIRTSGASRPTRRRSPTASAPDAFVLTLWTSDPALAARADAAGIDRVGVDLEHLGKAERQRGLGTWVSPHTPDDLARVGAALTRAELFARVDPLHDATPSQIDRVVGLGARVVMLPMVETAAEAARFVSLVGGRARVVPLVETAAALEAVGELAAVPGVDEIHIGLNDLALSLGLTSRWQILAGDRLLAAARAVHAAGKRFGFGGIGGVLDDTLPIPADLIYAEYARVGATAALIARAFPTTGDLTRAVAQARERLDGWRAADPVALATAHAELARRAAALTTW